MKKVVRSPPGLTFEADLPFVETIFFWEKSVKFGDQLSRREVRAKSG